MFRQYNKIIIYTSGKTAVKLYRQRNTTHFCPSKHFTELADRYLKSNIVNCVVSRPIPRRNLNRVENVLITTEAAAGLCGTTPIQ